MALLCEVGWAWIAGTERSPIQVSPQSGRPLGEPVMFSQVLSLKLSLGHMVFTYPHTKEDYTID